MIQIFYIRRNIAVTGGGPMSDPNFVSVHFCFQQKTVMHKTRKQTLTSTRKRRKSIRRGPRAADGDGEKTAEGGGERAAAASQLVEMDK